MFRRWFFPFVGAFVLSGCCGQCSKVVGHVLEEAPEKDGKEKLVLSLKTQKGVATDACGVSATGLTDVKFKSYTGGRGLHKAEIEGKPILSKNVKVDPGKALVCVAVVSFAVNSIRNEKDEITGWKVTSVYLDDVKTPGVTWSKPSSGGWDD